MSFSSTVKDELAGIKTQSREERLSILCGLTHTAAAVTLGRGGLGIEYVSESENVAELARALTAELYGLNASFSTRKQEGLKRSSIIVHVSGEGCRQLLIDCGSLPNDDNEDFQPGKIPESMAESDERMRCLLRGAFLGGGSVSDPKKGYHLEIVTRQESFADILRSAAEGYGIRAKVTARKANYIFYLKEGESVSDFLSLVGAMNGTMEFEQIRVLRFMANDINRRTNFEDANMQKAAMASAQQRLDIQLIIKEHGMESLGDKLRQTAEARINNPEATLTELAKELDITKSCLTHRLKKLSQMAEDIRLHGSGAMEGTGEENI